MDPASSRGREFSSSPREKISRIEKKKISTFNIPTTTNNNFAVLDLNLDFWLFYVFVIFLAEL